MTHRYTHTHKHTLLQARADQVIWLLLGCGGDVIVIGGRAGVMTLNEPTAGCYWLVVYSHCHLSVFYRERWFDFALSLSCYFAKCLSGSHVIDFFNWLFSLNGSHFTVFPERTTAHFYKSFGIEFLYPFTPTSPHSISHSSVSGMVCTRRSGRRHNGAEYYVCVCQWDKVRVKVWPTQGSGSGSCLQSSGFISSPLLPSSIIFPASPSYLSQFLFCDCR